MDENKVTPDNNKDEFDDVLEIMKKRRTKPEYSTPRSGNISQQPTASSKPAGEVKSENNTSLLKGALAETVVIPVTKSSDSSSKPVSALKGTAITNAANKQGVSNPDATVTDMPAAKPEKSVNPDATAVHDAVQPIKPKVADNSATTVDAPVIKKPVENAASDDVTPKGSQVKTSDSTSHNISSSEKTSAAPVSKQSNANPEKTVEVSTATVKRAVPDATRVNIAPVKPVNTASVKKPATDKENNSSTAGGTISLDDFNSTSTGKKVPNGDEKVKVTFLGSVWFGIIKIVLYLCFVLAISSALAATVIYVTNDIFAFVKESEIVAEIPDNANSIEITAILNESGIIGDASDTVLNVTVKKNNSRKLADILNTTNVRQPLNDAGITKITIKSNNEFEVTVPVDADVSAIGGLLDTVDATTVKADMQIVVNIPEGATTAEVGKILKDAGVIKYSGIFKMYAEYRIDKRSYLTGEYIPGKHTLNPMMNYDRLLDTLSAYDRDVSGTVRITIPEGLTVRETIDLLVENGVGKPEDYTEALQEFEYEYKFVEGLTQEKLSVHRFDTDISYRLEGYLFPDTYDFYYNENPVSALDKFLSNFNRKFEEEYYERAAELGMTVDEVITLASMIEKEGNNPSDYYYISSVFHNRLNSSEYPYMNSDATVQYALSERAGLYDLDTSIDHPYNTYKNPGLSPGPICNPGIQAIDAALYPESTNYYYFYTKKNGETVYSRTYEEHQRHINADKASEN